MHIPKQKIYYNYSFQQLSQFWYDDKTTEYLSREACRAAGPTGKIALISCPTLYKSLKSDAHNNQGKCHNGTSINLVYCVWLVQFSTLNICFLAVTLFEFDKRFGIYGDDFILYDYNKPLDIPSHFAGNFDVVVVDPPFISEECLTKTAATVKFLAKHKIILCTGLYFYDIFILISINQV